MNADTRNRLTSCTSEYDGRVSGSNMKPDSSPQNKPQPDDSFGPEFMEKFKRAIEFYAEAIASDQAEEAVWMPN